MIIKSNIMHAVDAWIKISLLCCLFNILFSSDGLMHGLRLGFKKLPSNNNYFLMNRSSLLELCSIKFQRTLGNAARLDKVLQKAKPNRSLKYRVAPQILMIRGKWATSEAQQQQWDSQQQWWLYTFAINIISIKYMLLHFIKNSMVPYNIEVLHKK